MAIGTAPDWTQVTWLIADYEGTPTLVAVDADGNLTAVMKGVYDSTLKTITLDAGGRIISVIRDPTSDNYVAIDADGFLTAILKGLEGTTLRTIAVDDEGQIIMVPKGESGNYMLVDASGYLTTVMKGIEGSTLRTIAVDADGNIVGVFKGLYDSTLTTLKVDEDGRMIAILTDPEDQWGAFKKLGFAGLSSVLSFAYRYDSRGSVVYMEGFENGLGSWVPVVDCTDGEVNHTTKQSFSPPYSCELVASDGDNKYSEIQRYLPFPLAGKFGLEVSFTLDPETDDVRFILAWYDGTDLRAWEVNYDLPNTTLACGGSDGQHTTLNSSLDLRVSDTQFHTIKFVCDMDAEEFVRVLCNSLSYTPTTADVFKTSDTSDPHLVIYIRHYSTATPALSPNIYIDNIILTHLEED